MHECSCLRMYSCSDSECVYRHLHMLHIIMSFKHIHTYIHTHIHTHIHTYMHACMHIYIHTYICTYVASATRLCACITKHITQPTAQNILKSVRCCACGAVCVAYSIINAARGTVHFKINTALCLRCDSFVCFVASLPKSCFLLVPAGTAICIDFALTSVIARSAGTMNLH